MLFEAETLPGRVIRLARELIREPEKIPNLHLLRVLPLTGKKYLFVPADEKGRSVAVAEIDETKPIGLFVLGRGRWHEEIFLSEIGLRTDLRLVHVLCGDLEISVPRIEELSKVHDRILARSILIEALRILIEEKQAIEKIACEKASKKSPIRKPKLKVMAGGMS